MAELRIYDSQGQPIRDESGRPNQTVKDFFFDGVRFAVDKNRNEAYCFFRARENETARSEQYYAMYNYTSPSQLENIVSEVEARIEGEYGMALDRRNDDTRFFELLSSAESGRQPGDMSTVNDVEELLSDYRQAKLGVGSYGEAYYLFGELFDSNGVATVAVSENATGGSVSSYDLVIEQGDHFGLELLGETEEAVEELREQRRSMFESAPDPDDGGGLSGVQGAALFGFVGVLLLVGGAYGGCAVMGMDIPGIGAPPGVSCGADAGLTSVSAEVDGTDSQQVRINGSVSEAAATNGSFSVHIDDADGNPTLNNHTVTERIDTDGNFSFAVPIQGSSETTSVSTSTPSASTDSTGGTSDGAVPDGRYTVTVTYEGTNKTDTFCVGDCSTPTPTSEPEATATATDDGTSETQVTGITASGTVDNGTADITVSGEIDGVSDSSIELPTDLIPDAGDALRKNPSVDIATDGSFEYTLSFDVSNTEGPYTVTVYYNDSEASDGVRLTDGSG